MSAFLRDLWDNAAPGPDVHARATRGGDRALCTVAVVLARDLSVEAQHDEDADVTCAECMRTIGAAAVEARS